MFPSVSLAAAAVVAPNLESVPTVVCRVDTEAQVGNLHMGDELLLDKVPLGDLEEGVSKVGSH